MSVLNFYYKIEIAHSAPKEGHGQIDGTKLRDTIQEGKENGQQTPYHVAMKRSRAQPSPYWYQEVTESYEEGE